MWPRQVRGITVALSCLILEVAGCFAVGKVPFLLTFPTISADTSGIYFKGETWTAVWRPEVGRPACIPTSLIQVPPPETGRTVFYGRDHFAVSGDTLWWTKGILTQNIYVLPDPTEEVLRELREVGRIGPEAVLALEETMGPVAAGAGRIWFGLILFDALSEAAISGLGWFDIETERFVRLYSADMGRCEPVWMTAFPDSILVLYHAVGEGDGRSRLYLYQIVSGDFFEVEQEAMGIAGECVLGAFRVGDSLFFSTDQGISLWHLGGDARNFATLAVASRMPVGLSLCTFDSTVMGASNEVPFDTLPPGVSTRIWWREGDWYEVAVPRPVEGFVDTDVWEKFSGVWENRLWDCVQEPCFARVRIPMRGQIQLADFIHTPLTYLGHDTTGVKIGVDAAWVRVEDVIPIFMETRPSR